MQCCLLYVPMWSTEEGSQTDFQWQLYGVSALIVDLSFSLLMTSTLKLRLMPLENEIYHGFRCSVSFQADIYGRKGWFLQFEVEDTVATSTMLLLYTGIGDAVTFLNKILTFKPVFGDGCAMQMQCRSLRKGLRLRGQRSRSVVSLVAGVGLGFALERGTTMFGGDLVLRRSGSPLGAVL
ncbi:hypothetical protein ACLB2K_011395 [Fragaria x ananassa]